MTRQVGGSNPPAGTITPAPTGVSLALIRKGKAQYK